VLLWNALHVEVDELASHEVSCAGEREILLEHPSKRAGRRALGLRRLVVAVGVDVAERETASQEVLRYRAVDLAEALPEIFGEQRDVGPAPAERRELDATHREPKEEIFAEAPGLHFLLEVAACRRDRADVDDGTINLWEGYPIEIGMSPHIAARSSQKVDEIALQLACVRLPWGLPFPAVGSAPVDVRPGRRDVEDVDVTMADGTRQKVRGTYDVRDASSGERVLANDLQPPTNTGVDLPPGRYKVIVTYPTTAGASATFEDTFTTP
jgi:hypothetical protein